MPEPTTQQPTAEELAAAVNNVALSTGAVPTEITTTTGQVFRGKTPQELIDQMKHSVENGTSAIKNLNDRLSAQETELARLREAAAQPPAPTNATPDPNTEFYSRFTQNAANTAAGVTAMEYALSGTLGVEPTEVRSTLQRAVKSSEEARQERTANAFMTQVPEYQNTPQNGQLITQALSTMGLEPSVPNLVYAYHTLVHRGLMQAGSVPVSQNTVQPPPMLQGSSAPSITTGFDMSKFANLSAEQQRQVIEEMHGKGYK